MSNDILRGRIAESIRAVAGQRTHWIPGPYVAGLYADAVIEALELTEFAGIVVGCIHDE